MAKNKKGARGANTARGRAAVATSRPAHGHHNNHNNHANAFYNSGPPADGANDARGFTLQDEARNTAHGSSSWDQGSKLRDKPVAFISAGQIEPLPEIEVGGTGNTPLGLHTAQAEPVLEPSRNPGVTVGTSADQTQPSHVLSQADVFVPESIKPATIHIQPVQNVSEMVPFFFDTLGDKALRAEAEISPGSPCNESAANETDSSEDVILFKGRDAAMRPVTLRLPLSSHPHAAGSNTAFGVMGLSERTTVGATRTNAVDEPAFLAQTVPYDGDKAEDLEQAVLADYICNVDDNDLGDLLQAHRLAGRDLADSEDAVFSGTGTEDNSSGVEHSQNTKRQPTSNKSRSEQGCEEVDDMEADIDDAQLAALLSKQEELGLGGDELFLFDDSCIKYPIKSKHKKSSAHDSLKAPLQSRHGRPMTASEMADAFDELDLASLSIPNLRIKTRGAHGPPSFDVSDSELEQILESSWQKDRQRKKKRKAQREELRAQGLLGKKANPDDPRVKYPGGISLESIQVELRKFLVSSDDTLHLPPMDASARKIIHEIANRFKIKSKSAGSGDQRRPILHRTKYTAAYAERSFEEAFSRVRRRYFPRLDERSRTSKRQAGSNSRVGNDAVTYREGEIVGGSAPEIAVTNRGRAILEKMGWMSGMALGAMDNKGIVQPIAHVVKRTKAGLG